MAVAPPLARIAPRHSLLPVVAILTAGVAVVLSPYLWSEAWRLAGFGPGLAQLYLWELMPFAALAAACALPRPPAASSLVPLLFAMLAANLLAEVHVNASVSGDNGVLDWLPPALTGAVVLAWAVRARPGITTVAWLTAGLAALALGRALPLESLATVETFVLLFASIAIEALPFVVLGAAVSAALEAFVPDRVFARIARLPVGAQVPAAVLSGMAFPVCECGSVPVARRLLLRGMHPSAGLAFMLAAPIINPVVLTSTYIAFQGRDGFGMVAGRAVLGLTVALAVGLVIGRRRAEGLLRRRDDGHGSCSAHEHGHASRLRTFSDHLTGDVVFMGRFVVAGAALAAAAQVLVPQSVFAGVLAGPVVGGLVLMGAAFVLSLCSEADAFVAVSFVQFPVASQLAFLVFGPVLDIKLALLYRGTFGRGFVIRLVAVAMPVVLAGSLLAGAVIG